MRNSSKTDISKSRDCIETAYLQVVDAYLQTIRKNYSGLSEGGRKKLLASLEDAARLTPDTEFDWAAAKETRVREHLTMKELGALVGLSPQAICAYENGVTNPIGGYRSKKYLEWVTSRKA